jgi:hypothetical protein
MRRVSDFGQALGRNCPISGDHTIQRCCRDSVDRRLVRHARVVDGGHRMDCQHLQKACHVGVGEHLVGQLPAINATQSREHRAYVSLGFIECRSPLVSETEHGRPPLAARCLISRWSGSPPPPASFAKCSPGAFRHDLRQAMGRDLVDTFITEVSQDTWIFFPWDLDLAYVAPIIGGTH